MTMKASEFFAVDPTWPFVDFFAADSSPVEWVKNIGAALRDRPKFEDHCRIVDAPKGCYIGKDVFIHKSVVLPPICVIAGPAYIGENTEIRPFAYVRENVFIGKNCLIGNSCEIKNSIILNNAQVPHFNYVGDSVLGNYAHLGAGVILANVRLDKKEIFVNFNGTRVATGMRKFGAIVGDYSEIACNFVLSPGTVLEKNSMVFGGRNRSARQ